MSISLLRPPLGAVAAIKGPRGALVVVKRAGASLFIVKHQRHTGPDFGAIRGSQQRALTVAERYARRFA